MRGCALIYSPETGAPNSEAPGDSLTWGQLALMGGVSVETLKAVANSFDANIKAALSHKQRAYILARQNVDAATAKGISWQDPAWTSLTDVLAQKLGVRSKETMQKQVIKSIGPVTAPAYKLLPGVLVSKTAEELGGVTAPGLPKSWLLIGALALGAFLFMGRR